MRYKTDSDLRLWLLAGTLKQSESDKDVERGEREKKKTKMNNLKNTQYFRVELSELRKYYNIQMECKNKCETFQVGQHLIGAALHREQG